MKEEIEELSLFEYYPTYPRITGNPVQSMCNDLNEFIDFIITNNGINHCFTSHNSYVWSKKNTKEVKHFDKPSKIVLERVFYDFDSKKNMEQCLIDITKMVMFSEKFKIDYSISFSANKGFHFYHHFSPRIINYSADKDDEERLKEYYNGIFYAIHNKLKLKTLDFICQPIRLCRIINTVNPKTGMYCTSLPPDKILEWGIDDVVEYAKKNSGNHKVFIKRFHDVNYTFGRFITFFNIKRLPRSALNEFIKITKTTSGSSGGEENDSRNIINLDNVKFAKTKKKVKNDVFVKYLQKFGFRPCIINDLQTKNPAHTTRIEVVIILRDKFDFTPEEINEFWEELAEHFGYIDIDNHKTRWIQINDIFNRKHYRPHTCLKLLSTRSTLTGRSLCIGKTCPHFETLKRRLRKK
ncbi:MAG: hypothetical protein DRJ64_06545 [Thermoprotei archaeon]|nr:MAG: hypothetical protein DRJ64_06545 [Thermoprotei archaeon]